MGGADSQIVLRTQMWQTFELFAQRWGARLPWSHGSGTGWPRVPKRAEYAAIWIVKPEPATWMMWTFPNHLRRLFRFRIVWQMLCG